MNNTPSPNQSTQPLSPLQQKLRTITSAEELAKKKQKDIELARSGASYVFNKLLTKINNIANYQLAALKTNPDNSHTIEFVEPSACDDKDHDMTHVYLTPEAFSSGTYTRYYVYRVKDKDILDAYYSELKRLATRENIELKIVIAEKINDTFKNFDDYYYAIPEYIELYDYLKKYSEKNPPNPGKDNGNIRIYVKINF